MLCPFICKPCVIFICHRNCSVLISHTNKKGERPLFWKNAIQSEKTLAFLWENVILRKQNPNKNKNIKRKKGEPPQWFIYFWDFIVIVHAVFVIIAYMFAFATSFVLCVFKLPMQKKKPQNTCLFFFLHTDKLYWINRYYLFLDFVIVLGSGISLIPLADVWRRVYNVLKNERFVFFRIFCFFFIVFKHTMRK